MRLIRFLIVGLLLVVLGAPVIAGTPEEDQQRQEDRDAARAAIRAAIKLEKSAADNIPFDFDAAKQQLAAAGAELRKIDNIGSMPFGVYDLAHRTEAVDNEMPSRIDRYKADGEVTAEELEELHWRLRKNLAMKNEMLRLIYGSEWSWTGKKPTPDTKVGAPQCQTSDQQVAIKSSCFTVDTWKVFIPRDSRAAHCEFKDDEGRRLTNLRPLFENVIQETTCKLLDKTVVVNGVVKRVVRATLKLSALSSSDVRGTATVKVVALYR